MKLSPLLIFLPVVLQFDLSGFLGGLIGVLQGLLAQLISAIVFLFQLLQAVSVFIWNALVATVQFLLKGFQVLLRGLKHVISDVVHLRFRHLLEDYLKLKQMLNKWLEPVLKIIRRIREIQQLIFDTWIRPVLNMLQHIRQVLAIFRIFHLKFAEKLDRQIAELEGKIIRNTLRIVQEVNRIASFIELILDPLRFFPQGRALVGVLRGLADLFGGSFKKTLQDLFGTSGSLGGRLGSSSRPRDTFRSQRDEMLSGTGDYGVIAERWRRVHKDVETEVGG